MGLFDKFKKKKTEFKQDTTQVAGRPGGVFIIHLLMEEPAEMPSKEEMHSVISRHLGDADCFCHDGNVAGFAPKNYSVHFAKDNVDMPPQLMVTHCAKIEKPVMDAFAASQLWDCAGGEEILERCKYQVIATDMLASGLDYKERAEMLVKFTEALAQLYPSCKAFVFESSKKMIPREGIVNCALPRESRFIYYAVNVRFFNIEGTEDKIVDTIGMSSLFLPDLQYHFRGIDPNRVVNHAYNMLSYIYDNANPIKDGDTVDGILNGRMSREVQWLVQYENSLIQPVREVIDINMGQYAAGNR